MTIKNTTLVPIEELRQAYPSIPVRFKFKSTIQAKAIQLGRKTIVQLTKNQNLTLNRFDWLIDSGNKQVRMSPRDFRLLIDIEK